MTRSLLPITALLMSVALLFAANGLLGVLLPVRALLLDFSSIDIGIMGTAYFSGFLAGCVLGPRLIRRVGHIRTFAALISIVCTLVLLHGLTDVRSVWWLARGATGLCFAISYIVIESWLNDKATNANRGFVFSVYTIINLTVITIGQMVITLGNVNEFALFAVAAMLVSLSTLPVVVSVAVAPTPPATVSVRLPYLFRRSHVAIVACLGVGMCNGAFWALAPVFVQGNTPDTTAIAIFMSLAVISGAIGQWPLGHLSDSTDRRKVIVGSSIGAGLGGIILISVTPTGPFSTYIGAILYGACAFPLYALCAAHLNDFVEEDGYVEAASGLLMVYATGAIVGPLIASGMMQFLGGQSLFAFTAIIHFMVAGFALYRLFINEPETIDERAVFADALVMTSMSAEIDPRPSD